MPYFYNIHQLDTTDALAPLQDHFTLPPNRQYCCAHSLGAMPKGVNQQLHHTSITEWGQGLVSSWNDADWINLPQLLGTQVAALIGAQSHEVVVCDSISINLYKVLMLALALNANQQRRTIVTDQDNFPADLYVAAGVADVCNAEVVPVPTDKVLTSINDRVAVVMLTHVNYRTAALYDIASIVDTAHHHGALVVFDLAHSTGVFDLQLNRANVDFAVGCTYKYLNGGPGAPGFVFIAEKHQGKKLTAIQGWMGHHQPFAFSPQYVSADSARAMLCGTPPILSMRALQSALDVFEGVALADLRRKSQQLGDVFIHLMDERCPQLTLLSPRDADRRGAHIAYTHPESFALSRALIARQAIVDYRNPDCLRLGFSPLYTSFADLEQVASKMATILQDDSFQKKYQHAIHQGP